MLPLLLPLFYAAIIYARRRCRCISAFSLRCRHFRLMIRLFHCHAAAAFLRLMPPPLYAMLSGFAAIMMPPFDAASAPLRFRHA